MNSLALSRLRAYCDAWGTPTSTTGWMQMYCANLGHRQDDESGLVYMRARYYEPGTGRFVSEDPSRNGSNIFLYCENDPVNLVDLDGRDWWQVGGGLFGLLWGIKSGIGVLLQSMRVCVESFKVGAAGIAFLAAWFGGLRQQIGDGNRTAMGFALLSSIQGLFLANGMLIGGAATATGMLAGVSVKEKAKAVYQAYGTTLLLFFAIDALETELGW